VKTLQTVANPFLSINFSGPLVESLDREREPPLERKTPLKGKESVEKMSFVKNKIPLETKRLNSNSFETKRLPHARKLPLIKWRGFIGERRGVFQGTRRRLQGARGADGPWNSLKAISGVARPKGMEG
jgi:hypothetical protein